MTNRYGSYKTSGIPWIDVLPSHWEVKPLLAVARERDVRNTGLVEDNLLSLSYGSIVRKDISSNEGLLPESFETYQIVEPDNVVFRLTDLQNDKRSLRTGQVRERGIITSAYLAVEPTGIHPGYFGYLLRAYDLSKVFYSMGGGLRQSMKYDDVRRMPVVLPPTPEQAAITAFLDRETGKIEALVEEQQLLIELLKEKRQAVISHAVTKGLDRSAKMRPSGIGWLGDMPHHWQMKRLKYLGEAIIGLTYSPADVVDEGAGLLVLRSSNVQGGKITLDDNVYVASTPPERLLTREGDILICTRNGSRALIGKNATIHGPSIGMTFGAFMTIFRSPLNSYLSWVFASSLFETQSGAYMSSTINQLTTSTLNAMEVPVPPDEERAAIAKHLAQTVGNFEVLIDQAHSSIKLLEERRAALISAAVTGKIAVLHIEGRDLSPSDTARLRTAVAAEIVDLLSHKRSFGRVKLQKLLYLAEADAGIVELQGQYLREAAGPLDRALIAEVDAGLQQDQHVTVVQSDGPGSQVVYHLRGERGAYHDELLASIGNRVATLHALVERLGDLDTKSVEAVTTLYAVWNDALLDRKEPTDAMVVSSVLEDWHPEKARKFKAEELLTWLGWMRRNKLVPRGNEPRTTTGRLFA